MAQLPLVAKLQSIVGATYVLTSDAARIAYECDAYTLDKQKPTAIVLPKSTQEVIEVVKLCHQYRIPITPRGAGTSLAGGAIPLQNSIVIALTRMNRILEVDLRNRFAVVEPGVVNLRLSEHLKGSGLHYAPDPSSQGACTIGGNVATNSGGPHTLKYGVTVNHVLGLEVILPDGECLQLGGPINSFGAYDLAGLFVGSEGTFGLCTKIWVKLTKDPQSYRTLLAFFDSIDDASQSVGAILSSGVVPAAIEMMDSLIIEAVEDAFHFGFPKGIKAALIVEVDGFEASINETAKKVEEILRGCAANEVKLAKDAEERAHLWKSRKRAFGAVGRLAPSYCCQDGVVPRRKIPQMMRFISEVGERYQLRIANVFHAGDGNLHPILLFDERKSEEVQRVLSASHEILQECIRLGGSITGEHGVGIEKISLMSQLFSEGDLEVMSQLRAVFDPLGLCNPQKVLPGSGCVELGLRASRRAT
jgi:glycolate oxidase